MDNTQFQTSFIPKKPIMGEPLHHVSRATQRSVGIFSVIAFLAVVVAGGSYAGLYFYKATLTANVATAKKSLALAKESFEPEAISDLQLFDKRIVASKQVLASHVVVSPFFELLNSLTLPSIQYTKFTAEGGTNGEGLNVQMSGNAKDYKSIAVQAGVFNSASGKYFKDVVFSNLTLSEAKDKKGYVTFNVAFTVDPVLISYEKQMSTYAEKKKKIEESALADAKMTKEETVEAPIDAVKDFLQSEETQIPVDPKLNTKKITP
jgi:hypothetical protein